MENNINLIENDILCQSIDTKELSYTQKYYQKYYQDNKDALLKQQSHWRELKAGDFVYFLIDKDNQFTYTGSWGNRPIIERLSLHLRGKSNLKMDANELVEKYNLSLVAYKNFREYGLNRQDLFFIENYYKTNFINIIDGNKVHYDEEELSRSKEELIKIAENEELQFFDFDKYLD